MATTAIPRAFIWRRVHSLMGLWLVLFLMEHLLTNSQAALWLGDNGRGFVDMVNGIHNLPFLQVIEFTLLGIPLLVHLFWGVKYLLTGKFVAGRTDGSAPSMKTGRNRAYKFQRITSWILLIGLIGHVTKFRFIDYPDSVQVADHTSYLIPVDVDNGLYTLAGRLNFTLYDSSAIAKMKSSFESNSVSRTLLEAANALHHTQFDPILGVVPEVYDPQKEIIFSSAEKFKEEQEWITALENQKLGPHQVLAVCKDFGTASLLSVRDTFKSPIYVGLYTLFVLCACFHAFNGLWTFLITWGWILKMSAQRAWVAVTVSLMLLLLFLGLASIWGTYWINLRY